MTREEAIKELRGFLGQLTEGCQEAIKVLIPELSESEDERIRKAIVTLIEDLQHYSTNYAGVAPADMLDWLEKQKEQKLNHDKEKLIKHCIGLILTDATDKRFKDYGLTLKDCLTWLGVQKEQKPVGWNKADCVKEIPFSLIYEEFAEHWRLGNAVEPGDYYIPISRLRWGIKGNLEEIYSNVSIEEEPEKQTSEYFKKPDYDKRVVKKMSKELAKIITDQIAEPVDLENYISNKLRELGADLINHKPYSFNRGLNVGQGNAYRDILDKLKARKEK